MREIHKLNLFTKNGNYMTINQRKIQNPDHFQICKFPSKIWEERLGRARSVHVCCEIFPEPGGGQNMIFVTGLSRSQLALGRQHTNTLSSQTDSDWTARWAGSSSGDSWQEYQDWWGGIKPGSRLYNEVGGIYFFPLSW